MIVKEETREKVEKRSRQPRSKRSSAAQELKKATILEGSEPTDRQDDPFPAIQWTFRHKGCWLIRWKDADGKKHRNGTNFVVPSSNADGELLSAEKYDKMVATVHQQAKQAWNALDTSGKPRLL